MAIEKCPRCGHELTRRKYARQPTPHTTNALTPPGECHGCRSCYEIKRAKVKR